MKEPSSEHTQGRGVALWDSPQSGGVALWDSIPKGVAGAEFHMDLRGDWTNIWKSTKYI